MTLSPSQIEALRPEFEAWFRAKYPEAPEVELVRYDDQDCGYKRPWTAYAWEGWIAAKSSPVVVTPEMVEPCTKCHCHERAMKMLGDPREGVFIGPPQCSVCGSAMILHMWPRPGGPPGNGYGCPKCNPPSASP